MERPKKCPKCSSEVGGVEYAYGSPFRYDGISEFICVNKDCDWRIGRWCGQELHDNEIEARDCTGSEYHGRRVDFNDAKS